MEQQHKDGLHALIPGPSASSFIVPLPAPHVSPLKRLGLPLSKRRTRQLRQQRPPGFSPLPAQGFAYLRPFLAASVSTIVRHRVVCDVSAATADSIPGWKRPASLMEPGAVELSGLTGELVVKQPGTVNGCVTVHLSIRAGSHIDCARKPPYTRQSNAISELQTPGN